MKFAIVILRDTVTEDSSVAHRKRHAKDEYSSVGATDFVHQKGFPFPVIFLP